MQPELKPGQEQNTIDKGALAPEEAAPRRLPEDRKGLDKTSAPALQPAPLPLPKEGKSPFELSRRNEARVDRAADYSWLTGQLFYVHADGGLWVLRYAPLSKEDGNGGGVVLARDDKLDSYRDGDLVRVRGELLGERGSKLLGAPLYRARAIELLDRGQ
jgi:hypothetical protein